MHDHRNRHPVSRRIFDHRHIMLDEVERIVI